MKSEKETFSEKISNREIEKWKNGDKIILDGGTGTGKTHFIINKLANKVKEENKKIFNISNRKKILYICNREKLKKQVVQDIQYINNQDLISVTTYQSIEKKIINSQDQMHFDYIVCDETHYFLNDAEFNKFTDISFNYINSQTDSIRIFMSATAVELFTKLKQDNNKIYEYTIEKDYSYVERLYLLSDKDSMKEKILELLNNTNDKIVYFCNSTQKAYDLYLELKNDAHFFCSQYNKKFNKYSESDCIIDNRNTITFNKRLLITTVALDNGINLKDRKIKHILSDVFDSDKLIQCLGRKRIIDNNDTCKFYIKKFTKREINGYKRTAKNILRPAELFKKDREEFDNEFLNNRKMPSKILYTSIIEGKEKVTLNELEYAKYKLNLLKIEEIENEGYKKYILSKFGKSLKRANIVDVDKKKKEIEINELELYLDSKVGQKLYKENQKEVIEKIGLKDSRGRLQKSISMLNVYFDTNNMGYIIIPKKSNGNRYWKIETIHK